VFYECVDGSTHIGIKHNKRCCNQNKFSSFLDFCDSIKAMELARENLFILWQGVNEKIRINISIGRKEKGQKTN